MNADYPWQDLYHAAILETDDTKLLTRLPAAKAAIDARLHDLHLDHGGAPEEKQAITDALAGLNVLQGDLAARMFDQGSNAADQRSD